MSARRPSCDAVLASLPGRHQEMPWSRLHIVEPNAGGWFDVTSARSGERYRVTPEGGDRASCSCKAGKSGMPCSHVVAVREYALAVLADVTRRRINDIRA